MSDRRRRTDLVVAPDFLSELDSLSVVELRHRRAVSGEVENELSYQRRLIHARLDIVAFEQRRRAGEEDRSVIEALDEILADAELPARHRAATSITPAIPGHEDRGRRRIDQILADDFPARIDELDDNALTDALETLRATETEITALRSAAQNAYDSLGAEISRRYRLGLTSIDELLQD